jgi:hypothetical protein
MRIIFVSLFLTVVVSILAQQTSASEQLREKFVVILKQQLSEMVGSAAEKDPQMPAEEVAKGVDALTRKGAAVYRALLTVPEGEANRLLTTGPDNNANMAAMRHDIELWKRVERPMPTLYRKMQTEVTNGQISDGLELELTRRISEFHLRQLGLL